VTPNVSSPASPKKFKLGAALFTLLTLLTLILTGCGGSTNASKKAILTVGAQSADVTQAGFNPYNPQPNMGVLGLIYEPLFFSNINDGSYTPWLATSYQWSDNNTTLTFTTRPNVKWSDGQSFSADDVAFTFNAMKQYVSSGADPQGVWNYLSSVTASDANTVVMKFQKAYPPEFWAIGSQVYIIPKHIFASVGDITKYSTDKPIGSGPFVMARYSPEIVVYNRNPSYWQANKLHVDEVRYPVYKDNDTFKLVLPKGEIDWAGYFQPDLQTAFVSKDPAHNHYWMAPVAMFTLFVNQTRYPLNQVAVRQAINAALDRDKLSSQAEAGLVGPASPTGLVLPAGKPFLDPTYANIPTTANAAQAQKYLTDAGFVKGSDGIFADKSGKRLSFTLRTVATYSDWETMAQIIKQNLKDAGIEIKSFDEQTENAYYPGRTDGKFDLMIGGMLGGPTPYYMYNTYLNSKAIPPAGLNFEHWNNPQTDQFLQQYVNSTDPNAQKQAILGLEKIYMTELPTIPLVQAPAWFEYRTANFTGWPTQDNPYALGSPYQAPDEEVVILHLTPVS
jgi:peptide/nickel transport system substrate-binding protein